MPAHLKHKVSDTVNEFIQQQAGNAEFGSNPYGKKRWEGLVQYMNTEDWSHKLPMLQEYLTITDQQRGTDFRKTFPELMDLF